MRRRRAPGLGSRIAGDYDGAMVFRVIEER
jgi:hypothetical protein